MAITLFDSPRRECAHGCAALFSCVLQHADLENADTGERGRWRHSVLRAFGKNDANTWFFRPSASFLPNALSSRSRPVGATAALVLGAALGRWASKKLRLGLGLALMVGLWALARGLASDHSPLQTLFAAEVTKDTQRPAQPPSPTGPAVVKEPRADPYGDPLPHGALAR